MSRILKSRDEIRQWAEARAGNPMLAETPDGTGTRTLLQLTFGQQALNADENEGPDRPGGFELVSWDDWFAALEAEGLTIRVSDDPSGGPEAEFARTLLLNALETAIAQLPVEQRDVFIAHELEGRSFKEMSAATGVSINTLLSRKRYAVLRLRERLRAIYDDITTA